MLFLPSTAASPKGLGDAECLNVSFLLLVFQAPLWMFGRIRVSGCWKAVDGGGSTTLGMDLNPLAELSTRDERRSMSEGGNGRGRVIVITEIVRKRRKSRERRSSHLCPQQSFDNTRQAMVHIPGRVHSTSASLNKSFIAHT